MLIEGLVIMIKLKARVSVEEDFSFMWDRYTALASMSLKIATSIILDSVGGPARCMVSSGDERLK